MFRFQNCLSFCLYISLLDINTKKDNFLFKTLNLRLITYRSNRALTFWTVFGHKTCLENIFRVSIWCYTIYDLCWKRYHALSQRQFPYVLSNRTIDFIIFNSSLTFAPLTQCLSWHRHWWFSWAAFGGHWVASPSLTSRPQKQQEICPFPGSTSPPPFLSPAT